MITVEHFICPGGCGLSLSLRYDAATKSVFKVCTNPACPKKVDCPECARPMQPLTDQRLGVRLIKEPKSRCTNPDCSLFKKLIDDGWPPRFVA